MITQLQVKRRGVVLLLVMAAVALLAILAVEVSHRARMDIARTTREAQNVAFDRCFLSARELAKGMLTEGRENGWDTKAGRWAKSQTIELNPGEQLTVTISDEAGKLNLLQLTSPDGRVSPRPDPLDRLFDYLKQEDSDHDEHWTRMAQAVRKRLDGMHAHELLTLDGLRDAGLTRADVFGVIRLEKDQEVKSGHPKPLCDLLTVVGNGKCNLNTAEKAVLISLDPRMKREQVEQIALFRGDLSEGNRVPFQSKADLLRIPGFSVTGSEDRSESLYQAVQNKVDVKSQYFSAHMMVTINGKSREAWCFFDAPAPPYANPAPEPQVLLFEEIEP